MQGLADAYSDDSLRPSAAMNMAKDHQDKRNSDLKNTGVPVEDKKGETLVLPQSLHDFSPSVSQLLRIGRNYDSSSEFPSESVEIGRTGAINQLSSHGSLNSSLVEDSCFIAQDGITEHSAWSPLDINGGFAMYTELSFGFPCHHVSNTIFSPLLPTIRLCRPSSRPFAKPGV